MHTQSMETWGIWYIDKGFLFGLSSRGINLMNLSTEPVQLILSHLYITSFDASFMFGCVCSRHDFQRMLLNQIYRYTCACPCTPLGTYLATRWRVSDSPGSACPDSKLGAHGFFRLLIRDAYEKHGSSTNRPESFFPSPLLASRVFLCNSWASVLLFIIIYPFVISHLRLSVM